MRRDVTTLPFPIVPPTREAQRILMCPDDPFDTCYVGAWRCLVDNYADLKAKHVRRMLDLLEVDGRGMAGRGAARLLADRWDLREAIQAALDELMEDMG